LLDGPGQVKALFVSRNPMLAWFDQKKTTPRWG
jgi:hypothetical protein